MDVVKSLAKAAREDAVVAAGLGAFVAGLGFTLYKNISIPGRVMETARHGGDLVADVLAAHGSLNLAWAFG
jgi:hypothetical protein